MVKSELNEIHLPYPLRGEKRVWVYVPKLGGEKLPVIYMTDGQNLFDSGSTPYGCWDVVKAVENEICGGFGGAVIVGIDNSGDYRDSELTPNSIGKVLHRDMLNENFEPEGEIFDAFLMNTVIPYVEENFPVKTGGSNRAICGSSSGGLQAFFEGVENKDEFAAVGALSPAFLLYSEDDWKNYLATKINKDLPYLYIYSGAQDELENMIFQSVEMLYDLLLCEGYPYDKINEVVLLENGHNERAWKEIFRDFLHTCLCRAFKPL